MIFIDSLYGDNIDYNDQSGNIGRFSAESDELFYALFLGAGGAILLYNFVDRLVHDRLYNLVCILGRPPDALCVDASVSLIPLTVDEQYRTSFGPSASVELSFQKDPDNLIYRGSIFSSVELYVLRHGEAGKRIPNGSKDSERALTVTGKKEVVEIAKALGKLGVKFDFIAASPLKRASQTAEIVARTLKTKKANVEEWNELKPEGKRPELYRKLSQFKPESSVLIVGHEPYLSTVISEIAFGSGAGSIVLKKAGIAKLAVISFQPRIRGELRWLLTPKHLKRVAK